MKPVELEQAISSSKYYSPGCLVGFSGGADSTALLLALSHLGFSGLAVHFNHHLRGEDADRDAEWCRKFCETHRIHFRRIDLDGRSLADSPEGMEEAARRERLAWWRRLGASISQPVALAHHQGDVLENGLMKLARGANCSGVTGLREWRVMQDGVALWRPLLAFEKSDLEEYLRKNGIDEWCHDNTNDVLCCRRNIIRNSILPAWERNLGGLTGLRSAMSALADDAAYLEEAAERALRQLREYGGGRDQWMKLPPALFVRVFRYALELENPPSRATVQRLRMALENYHGGETRVPLDGLNHVVVSQQGLRLERGACLDADAERYLCRWNWRREPSLSLPYGNVLVASVLQEYPGERQPQSEYFDAESFPDILVVRTWNEGDAMAPFGLHGHHRSLKDIFNENGIHGQERLKYPLLCADESGIIWLAPLRRADFAPARPQRPCVHIVLRRRTGDEK